jgi:hypothetical protein
VGTSPSRRTGTGCNACRSIRHTTSAQHLLGQWRTHLGAARGQKDQLAGLVDEDTVPAALWDDDHPSRAEVDSLIDVSVLSKQRNGGGAGDEIDELVAVEMALAAVTRALGHRHAGKARRNTPDGSMRMVPSAHLVVLCPEFPATSARPSSIKYTEQ